MVTQPLGKAAGSQQNTHGLPLTRKNNGRGLPQTYNNQNVETNQMFTIVMDNQTYQRNAVWLLGQPLHTTTDTPNRVEDSHGKPDRGLCFVAVRKGHPLETWGDRTLDSIQVPGRSSHPPGRLAPQDNRGQK